METLGHYEQPVLKDKTMYLHWDSLLKGGPHIDLHKEGKQYQNIAAELTGFCFTYIKL